MKFLYTRRGVLCASAGIFLINWVVCRELFSSEYIRAYGSVEGSFITLAHWILTRWNDVGWLPGWFLGLPWTTIYQPGLHLTTAALAAFLHVSPARAYHMLAGFFYCFGPVTLFWMCRSLTRRPWPALTAGVLYSVFSVSVVFPMVRDNIGSVFYSRRLQIVTEYGEGPHTAALALMPLCVLFYDRACRSRNRWSIVAAILAIAACLLTNWTGSVGLAMALVSYLLAYARADRFWIPALAVPVLAYGLACPWIPPSTLVNVVFAAQHANGHFPFSSAHIRFLLVFVPAITALAHLFRRMRLTEFVRFSFFLSLFTATLFLVSTEWGFALLPQPLRWQMEFEMALTACIVFAAADLLRSWPRVRVAVSAALAGFCAFQVVSYRNYSRYKVEPIDMRDSAEYRSAIWFDEHMHGARVFAPGSISIWMNYFTETPQVAGCCDQGVTNLELRYAMHAIYTGQNAGEQDTEKSLLWLQAYGARAVEVGDKESVENYHPFRSPHKFDGLLPVLWRDHGDTVYGIPARSDSLAHVMNPSSLVQRAPLHGVDTDPLVPYVTALNDPSFPVAHFAFTSGHTAQITADLKEGEVISLQEGYAPGWKATARGRPVDISEDPLGMMVIRSNCTGRCVIDLVYTGVPGVQFARVAAGLCAVLVLAIALSSLRRTEKVSIPLAA